MKTTIELSDDLAARAREYAARRGTTLRAIIEEGLRRSLREEQEGEPFKLRDACVSGHGLQAPFADGDWAAVRDAAYGDRGG
jgi:Arc/MetJ family transcription regulator